MSAALAHVALPWHPPPATGSAPADAQRLLDGPPRQQGLEPLAAHLLRLGPRPLGGAWLVDSIEAGGLGGRGGGEFPVARKWRAVISSSGRNPLVVVNASEGEPLSTKDRVLIEMRAHLVLDGAALAAETVGAREVVIYLSRANRDATRAICEALAQRRRGRIDDCDFTISRVPHRYVAGEASAVARRLGGGPARPQLTPPHMSERGVNARPTLVQNAETLAHVALIARRGAGWFRECGTDASPGTALMTLVGDVRFPGVYEVDRAATVRAVMELAGGATTQPLGALLGGYFGSWLRPAELDGLHLDTDALRAHGAAFGCGVLAVLPDWACPVAEAARIAEYMAGESAGQCGPCVHGLRAIAETTERVVRSDATPSDVERLHRWSGMVRGRGACRHPDGAVNNLESALDVFAEHVALHTAGAPCAAATHVALPRPPRRRWLR